MTARDPVADLRRIAFLLERRLESTYKIKAFRGAGSALLGPLPAEVQNYTSYVGVPMTARANAEVARAFVRYLGSSDGQAVFADAGIEQ